MKDSADKPHTLSEADISTERTVSRRSMLGTIGIGAGVAAAAVLGAVTPAQARSDRVRVYCDNNRGDRRTCGYRDND